MRIIVCGGRTYDNRKALNKSLNAIHEQTPITCIIDGDAKGADWLASEWARKRGICNVRVPANWHVLGKRAGPIRNAWMLEHCCPDAVVAFPGGSGTDNMVTQAHDAGVSVITPSFT